MPLQLTDLPDLIERVAPAVVHIEVVTAGGRSNGSGFAIAPLNGAGATLITNAHVVFRDGKHTVTLHDHTRLPATVKVVDESTDVAILAIDQPMATTLEFRRQREVRVGEAVIAIGSPYGLAGTVTSGIVSALDRTMPAPNQMPIDGMIQTDALINPGNSGGPLIGLDGRVVGVNDQIRVDRLGASSGLGFAIPADTVIQICEEAQRSPDGVIRRASIRARLTRRAFTPEERKLCGQVSGAEVMDDPQPETPSARAGLRRADVIVALDGELVDQPADVFRLLTSQRIDRMCNLRLLREGALVEIQIVPEQRA